MSNPISHAFKKAKNEKRPALLTYTVAGDSSKKQSLEILKSISKKVDILEIGVPHNTPVADGSQIQTSSYRAIKNGIKINDIFKIVKDFKKFSNKINFIEDPYKASRDSSCIGVLTEWDEFKTLNWKTIKDKMTDEKTTKELMKALILATFAFGNFCFWKDFKTVATQLSKLCSLVNTVCQLWKILKF